MELKDKISLSKVRLEYAKEAFSDSELLLKNNILKPLQIVLITQYFIL